MLQTNIISKIPPQNMPQKKRNFVTQKVIPQSERSQRKIQNQQVDALHIKFQAYNHFLAMVVQNHDTTVSEYSYQLLQQYGLLEDLGSSGGARREALDESASLSQIHNSMFMLKIENERLRCREKLLQQKLECQKILYRKRQQDGNWEGEAARWMKIEEIKMLREEVGLLEGIVEKKGRLLERRRRRQEIYQQLDRIRGILEQENAGATDLVTKLSKALLPLPKPQQNIY